MKLITRQVKLARLLIEQDTSNTAAYYANLLGVSKRTIHNDLDVIEPYLKKNGYALEKKSGVGIDAVPLSDAILTYPVIDEPELLMSPAQRQHAIMIDLLFKEEHVSYQRLSELYYVSPSSIQTDIRKIKKVYLDPTTASIVNDGSGTYLDGNEAAFRSTFLKFNQVCAKASDLKDVHWNRKEFLSRHYGALITDVCLEIMAELEYSNISFVADHYKVNLLNILVIIAYRASRCQYIEDEDRELVVNEMKQMPYTALAKDILGRIHNASQIKFNEGDFAYLSKYLRANRISFNQTRIMEDHSVSIIVDQIVDKVSETLDVDLTNDEQLKVQLFTHLQSMIYRLKTGISIKNTLLSDIKDEFRVLFDVVWVVLNEVFSDNKIMISEDEAGFVLIYIQTALDKKEKSKRVLIVCPNGISTSQFIINRIRNMLPPLDIVEASSIDKAAHSDLSQFDFIISTTPVHIEEKPVITISPLLTERDVVRISQFYNRTFVLDCEENERIQRNYTVLVNYISEETILIDEASSAKEQVISLMCDRLSELGYTDSAYKDAVYHRETLGTTELGSGAAIPHGELKYVHKTVIGLCILPKAIKWQDYMVRVVAFPCIKSTDTYLVKNIFQDIFHLLKDRANIEQLSLCKTSEQVITFIKGASHD